MNPAASAASVATSAASKIIFLPHVVASAASAASVQAAASSPWADIAAKAMTSIPGSLAGAFFGALGAYSVQRLVAKRQEIKTAELAAHRTMFSLLQQMNTLVLIQRDFVHQWIDSPIRFLAIPATMAFDPERDAVDLSTLSYLLDKREGRQILYAFYMAQENYRETLRSWNDRSTLHRNEAQPKLAAEGFEGEAELTLADLKRVLGLQLLGSLINGTENCIQQLKRSFQLLAQSKIELRDYLVKRFGHGDFTNFEIDENFGLDQPYSRTNMIHKPNRPSVDPSGAYAVPPSNG